MRRAGIRRNIAIQLREKDDMSVLEKYKTMEYGPAPEDPKETLVWLDGHKRRFGHFIGGKWQAPAGPRSWFNGIAACGREL